MPGLMTGEPASPPTPLPQPLQQPLPVAAPEPGTASSARQGRRRAPTGGEAWRGAVADRLPPTLRSGALALSPPAVLALGAVAVVAVVVVGLLWATSRPNAVAVPPRAELATSTPASGPLAQPAAEASGAAAGPAAVLVVDVTGRVRRPGIVELPDGARVADALEAAGGVTAGADLRSLNLARRLVDGEQVLVLGEGETPPPGAGLVSSGGPGAAGAAPGAGGPGAATAGGSASGGQMDLNAATVDQFDTLPGVGPVLAQRIVDWRTEHGRFSSVDELREVDGIGESRFADLRDLVRV
ncbi:ComEA family DNA-binding protein [Motilibacter sp. E257]|uniref:ComEA family DNA-binding protein n=2 Tax=Motilibacter deserti TaxID=2714956 RepID=A0ABX0GP77_9ACTN|nr:ComEA family DNA-binding protein [Motilibacter deserti]